MYELSAKNDRLNWYKVYNVVGPVTVDSIKERINNGGARKDPYDF